MAAASEPVLRGPRRRRRAPWPRSPSGAGLNAVVDLLLGSRSKSDILASILERVNRLPLEIVDANGRPQGPVAERLLAASCRQDVLALCGFPFDINEIHRLARHAPTSFAAYWTRARTGIDDEVEA